jgi:regulator of protease activity HflC (stomatin/prohibitin superfamily)
MSGENAWDNGSWVRSPGDVKNIFWGDVEARRYRKQEEARRQEQEARLYRLKADWRARALAGPERAMKQYRNAIRKIGLMAVSEALGLG